MFFYQGSDIYLDEFGVLNKRLKSIDYLSVNYCINWFSILGVEKPLSFQKTKILSIFDLTSWLLLFFSLIVLSILNTKYKRNQNVVLTVIHSLLNHLEELISKSGKLIMIFLCLLFTENKFIEEFAINKWLEKQKLCYLCLVTTFYFKR